MTSEIKADLFVGSSVLSAPSLLPRAEVLGSQFDHILHSYHNECPWDPAMENILYTGFDSGEKEAVVIVQNLSSSAESLLARTPEFNFHSGSWCLWALGGQGIVYMTQVDGIPCPAVVPSWKDPVPIVIDDLLGCYIRCVDASGRYLYAYDLYEKCIEKDTHNSGIYEYDLEANSKKLIVSLAEVLDNLAAEERSMRSGFSFLNHSVPSPDRSSLFFKLINTNDGGDRITPGFWSKNLKTGEVHYLSDKISGHPIWMNDSKRILNILTPRDGSDNRWLVTVDFESGEIQKFWDFVIEGPGHFSISRDGRHVVTDAFTADGKQSPLYLLDGNGKWGREFARLNHLFQPIPIGDMYRITRGQPHPSFSPDGKKIAVNCNFQSECMKLVLLDV